MSGIGHSDLHDVSTPHATADIADLAITTGKLAAGAVTNAKVAAGAVIAWSKMAALTAAHILVGNGSNVPVDVAVGGDITMANDGTVTLVAGIIVNADVNASAAIVASKILISGTVVLSDWRHGSDNEKIDGAEIYAASVPLTALADPLYTKVGYYGIDQYGYCVYG